jgi:hypothetical protein
MILQQLNKLVVDFLNNLYGTNDVWKQTSYNTRGGIHKLGGTPFRKNYAGIGFKYDQTKMLLYHQNLIHLGH